MTTIDAVLNEGKETFKLIASANGGTANGTGTIVDKRFIGAIAIDLNGDGIQTLSIDKGVKFDISNSGEKLSTDWIFTVVWLRLIQVKLWERSIHISRLLVVLVS